MHGLLGSGKEGLIEISDAVSEEKFQETYGVRC